MSKKLTITMSDQQFDALERAAALANVPAEELAAAALAQRFGVGNGKPPASPEQDARVAALTFMRARGHLVDPRDIPPWPGVPELPPGGTPERERFEKEVLDELGEAFEQSGLSILDLIERR